MLHLPPFSLRGMSRMLGAVGLASVAVALARHALRPARRDSSSPAAPAVRLRAVPSRRDGHLGATEKEFDWVGAGQA